MIKKILNLVLVLFVFFPACGSDADNDGIESITQNVYYVATTGNDSNTGALNSPLKTINAAIAKLLPGDTVIVRGGTYYERITLEQENSGNKSKRITIKAYPGETPAIDGSNTTVIGWMAMVTITNTRYITLEGFDICNLIGTTPHCDPEGIYMSGDSYGITIKNCNIYNIKNTAPSFSDDNWRSAHAILVLGNGTSAMSDIVITGCTVHDINSGTSESVTLAGNIDGFTVSGNKVYDVENIGIIIAGGDNLHPSGNISTNYARNGVVCDNVVYNCSHQRSTEIWGQDGYGAIGIYVCGGTTTIIERNIVYSCDRGIGLVSESNALATKDCIVRNNFVYNCYRTGIYMGDYLNYTSGGTDNCHVVNNTLFNNNSVTGYWNEIEGEIRLTENCTNNTIKNNIIYANPNGDVFIHKYTATGSNNIVDYNLYYSSTGTATWIWNGTEYSGFGQWQAACGGDASSISGVDPLLLSTTTPDLRIQTASPAKNSGEVLSTDIVGETDIDGNSRIVNSKINIGAKQ